VLCEKGDDSTFSSFEVGLLDEIWHSAGKLEDNAHSSATADNDFAALKLLMLLSLVASCSLVMQLLFSSTNLSRSCELVEKRNRSFVIVRSDTGLRGSGKVFDKLENIPSSIRHTCEPVEDRPEIW
jgi:hypothetical protein